MTRFAAGPRLVALAFACLLLVFSATSRAQEAEGQLAGKQDAGKQEAGKEGEKGEAEKRDDPAKKPTPLPKPILHGDLSFDSIEVGLKSSAKSYRPLFVVYPGKPSGEPGDANSRWAPIEQRIIESNQKPLARFVSVEIRVPSSKQTIEIFGGVSQPMIALCDFRGIVLKRWDGDLPTRSSFRKFMKRAWDHNAKLAGRFVQATKSIEKARYALTSKKHKEAVLLYLEVEKLELPVDSKPAKDHAALRKEIDAKINERKKDADKKEDKKDYYGAISILETAMAEFPIPDVRDELRKKITKLYAKLRGYG